MFEMCSKVKLLHCFGVYFVKKNGGGGCELQEA